MRDNDMVNHPGTRHPRSRVVLFVAVAFAVLVADVVSKIVVVDRLSGEPPVRLLGGALYLLETRNPGAAFSVGTGATLLLSAIALVIVAVILRVARRLHSRSWAIALGLILGGAVGNLVDRLFRSPGPGRGHVVDWISVFAEDGHVWPVFNIADSAVVCGAILAAFLSVRGVDIASGRRDSASATSLEQTQR